MNYQIIVNRELQEIVSHGNASFPLEVYLDELAKYEGGFMSCHWHNELEFAVVLDGSVEFQVNGTSRCLGLGEGVFINSDCLHMARPVEKADSVFFSIVFHPSLLFGHKGSVVERRYVEPVVQCRELECLWLDKSENWQSEVLALLRNIYDAYRQKHYGFELEVRNLLGGLWLELVRALRPVQKETVPTISTEQQRMKCLLEYIHSHYMEKITLEDIARAASISKGECCRFFKKLFHTTPFEYLISYRIEKSKELLLSTEWNITQVAERVGFGSVSYYADVFRRKLNCTPSSYRSRCHAPGVKAAAAGWEEA